MEDLVEAFDRRTSPPSPRARHWINRLLVAGLEMKTGFKHLAAKDDGRWPNCMAYVGEI